MAEEEDKTTQREKDSSLFTRSFGVMKWICGCLYRTIFGRGIDLEKRLQHLSKEEVELHKRMKNRTHAWRRLARGIVLYSIVGELLVLGIAIMATRSPDIPWNLRALRVLPVFALPAFSAFLYSSCARFFRMRERKDQKTLERLLAERQAKIDELKQRTNYYATQQLIQRYDLDPTAKAAAASVLAAKLSAESGLNVTFKSQETIDNNLGSDENQNSNSDAKKSLGPRKRKGSPNEAADTAESEVYDETVQRGVNSGTGYGSPIDQQRGRNSGLLARVAAMLVGEDPSQCYALICRNCHMHNGLAPKEDFQYITYFCPHCHVLNGNQHLRDGADIHEVVLRKGSEGHGQLSEGSSGVINDSSDISAQSIQEESKKED